MSLPNPRFKPQNGHWQLQHNGKMMWAERQPFGIDKLYEPLELENISREASFKLVFIREIPDPNTFNGKIRRYFAQDIYIRLREDVNQSIVLKFSNKRYFVSDLSPLGQTFLAPLESTEYLIVEKSEPYLIDQQTAKEIMQTSGYAFGKIEVDANGNLEYFKTV